MSIPDLQPPQRTARCRTCAYVLDGLPTPSTCPECASAFNIYDASTVSFAEPVSRWKMFVPGLLAAVILAVASMVVLGVMIGSWGTALWIGVPTALGCLLGYEYRHVRFAGVAAMLVGLVTLLAVTLTLGLGGSSAPRCWSAFRFCPWVWERSWEGCSASA